MKLSVWAHRKPGLSQTTKYGSAVIAYRKDGRLVTEACCGERYAHIAPGLVFNEELYVGSYSDDWHGGPSGSLTDMVRWLADAEYPELGSVLWFA